MSPGANSIDTKPERSAAKGIGVGIGIMIVAFFVVLPFVMIVAHYLFLTGYAIVRALGPGEGENAVPVVVGFVLLTSALAILIAVTVHLVGRSITPKRKRTTD